MKRISFRWVAIRGELTHPKSSKQNQCSGIPNVNREEEETKKMFSLFYRCLSIQANLTFIPLVRFVSDNSSLDVHILWSSVVAQEPNLQLLRCTCGK